MSSADPDAMTPEQVVLSMSLEETMVLLQELSLDNSPQSVRRLKQLLLTEDLESTINFLLSHSDQTLGHPSAEAA